jgi:hypothetical protein
VARVTGMSRSTVQKGAAEVDAGVPVSSRVRRPGAGRKQLIDHDPGLLRALDDLVEPTARGDPAAPLRWTAKSVRALAGELTRLGHRVSPSKVGQLLAGLADAELAAVPLTRHAFHGEWNYTITPSPSNP